MIVQGRLKQRSFETREGEKRTVVELEADEVGASLRSATAKVSKANRGAGGNGSFAGGGGGGGGGGSSFGRWLVRWRQRGPERRPVEHARPAITAKSPLSKGV